MKNSIISLSRASVPTRTLSPDSSLHQHQFRSPCSAASSRRPYTSSDDILSPAKTAFDVIRRDLDYLEDQTGLDLHSPLGTVADVHDNVVAALNPLASETLHAHLEEQIAGLQQELAIAHQQVHVNEERLVKTIDSLGVLETEVSRVDGPPQRHEDSAPQKRRAGLHASLELSPELKMFWYPVEFSSRLTADILLPIELFGEQWVLFRTAQGAAACVRDECAHRACPLSLGRVSEGEIHCAYHGWRFDGSGECTAMPSTPYCRGVSVTALPVVETDGMIWVLPGAGDTGEKGIDVSLPAPPTSGILSPPPGYAVHAELVMDVPVEHGLLLENLLDLAHAPFTHTTTFAKGWPIPDVVRFKASEVLGGSWQPYPIDMQFLPPCGVLSTIGLTQPGKIERGTKTSDCRNHLHQMHVCLPASAGRTRLLYRMSLDFMDWVKFVPGIQRFWKSIAAQVLGEDLVLVEGQQERLLQGADVWGHPVPYDKLGVRYRRWRNAVAAGDRQAASLAESRLHKLSARELLFDPLESVDGT